MGGGKISDKPNPEQQQGYSWSQLSAETYSVPLGKVLGLVSCLRTSWREYHNHPYHYQ